MKPFWAGLIELGQKTVEVRSRHTRHRGPLLICTSKRPLESSVPAGVTLCIVDVVDSRPMRREDEAASGVAYDPSLFAWVIANPRPVQRVPVRGQLGFFDVELDGLTQR